ncbi:seryl-tRNA synthetase [Candidatus Endoriftia persephone str. Guaymas]|jgi:archaellum biogenesis protein FlaJ (TadC family)|uniref:Uncharacterized protein n=3 Tax=Gammaproteobacteria TaxID=1236 RepID=G2FE76_9GAMM|nr:hypothetical protein [Candidatus Endoriftia persephone]EGV52423.1 hypothetical protein Rifp1Sym_ai00200 [endosymbiont of Riftia pachyptila (vent Ph05)]EGW54846.1 hypothetical protein TevJSym_ah00240 [endosymbiont of Tevnia jerichonana (vent Tica)]MBA1329852.1 seryl-tRNA synthetase [Candidatus Endoriftia persephone str. Guaymas]USF89181.1 hypothetical protein L0Y14_08115 [Candidatus Endoriftia persephone]
MDWMKILAAAAMVMMLFAMWPAYKHWSQNGPKAEKGDWMAVLLPIGAVIGFVILLMAIV